MLNLSNIKSMDFEVEANICIVHLKQAVNHKGFNTKEIKYKMDYKTFIEKSIQWREFNSIK